MYNNSAFLEFTDPFFQYSTFYPDFHIINEIVGVLVPIGIWLVSFIITLLRFRKEKTNKNTSQDSVKEQNLNFTKLDSLKLWLSYILCVILVFWGIFTVRLIAQYM